MGERKLESMERIGMMPSETLLGKALIDDSQLLPLIGYWRSQLQNANNDEKAKIEVEIKNLEDIIRMKTIITASVFSATISEEEDGTIEVKEPKGEGNMKVVHSMNSKSVEDLLNEYAISLNPQANVYEELLNIDAVMSLIIDDKIPQTSKELIIQKFFLDSKRPFTAEAIRYWESAITTAALNNKAKDVTLEDHYKWLYETSKLNPHTGETINEPLTVIKKIVENIEAPDWDDVTEELKFMLVGSMNLADKTTHTLETAENAAKEYVKQYLDKLKGSNKKPVEEKITKHVLATNFSAFASNKITEMKKEDIISSFITSRELPTDGDGNFTIEVVYGDPVHKDNKPVSVKNKQHLFALLAKQYYTEFERDKSSTKKETKDVNIVSLSHIEELIANSTNEKHKVVNEIVDTFFRNEAGKIVESKIVDDLNDNELYKYINKEQHAKDALYKIYKVVKTNMKASSEPTDEKKKDKAIEEWTEPVIKSMNEIYPIGKELVKERNYTMPKLKEWGIKNLLNKRMPEQAENAVFKDKEQINVFINGIFKRLFEEDGKTLETNKEDAIAFIKSQVRKGEQPKMSILKTRLMHYLEEKKVTFKQTDLILLLKEAFPEVFQKRKKAEKIDTDESEITYEEAGKFVAKAMNELLATKEGKIPFTQAIFELRQKATEENWPMKVKSILAGNGSDASKKRSLSLELFSNALKEYEKNTTTKDKVTPDTGGSFEEDIDGKVILTERFSTKYPKVWNKIKDYTTLEKITEAVKFVDSYTDWKVALSMILEVIENGNVAETSNWSEKDAVEFVNHVLEIEDKSILTKDEKPKETPTTNNSSDDNKFAYLGELDKSKFKHTLRKIMKENEDTEELRRQLLNAIKTGKGAYVRKLPRKDDQALMSMLDKAKKDSAK